MPCKGQALSVQPQLQAATTLHCILACVQVSLVIDLTKSNRYYNFDREVPPQRTLAGQGFFSDSTIIHAKVSTCSVCARTRPARTYAQSRCVSQATCRQDVTVRAGALWLRKQKPRGQMSLCFLSSSEKGSGCVSKHQASGSSRHRQGRGVTYLCLRKEGSAAEAYQACNWNPYLVGGRCVLV